MISLFIIGFCVLCLLIVISQIDYESKVNFHALWYPEYYKEENFVFPMKNTPNDFDHLLITKGKEYAKERKIAICGLGRNIASGIPSLKKRLTFIGQHFQEYKIVIFENDSTDGTRNRLREWEKEDDHVVLLDCMAIGGGLECQLKSMQGYDMGWKSNQRFTSMAFYREQYLNYIKNHLSHYDYMMVSDFDLQGSQCLDGLFYSLADLPDWDVLLINGRSPFPLSSALIL